MQKIIDKLQTAEVIVVDELSFGKLLGRVEAQGEKLTELTKAVYGNGRSGLVETTGRIEGRLGLVEERLGALDGRINSVDTKLDGLDTKLDTITSLLEKHINDPNLHTLKGLIWHRKIITDIVIAFILFSLLLHTIIPSDLVVWDIIKNWLGI